MAAASSNLEFETVCVDSGALPDDAWMVHPCEWYKEEYKDCKSLKARFHQYFVHGQTVDCTQWQNDFKNCMSWRKYRDIDAFKNVLESERNRIIQRQAASQANNIWELRKEPPEDWNKPLPDWMQKEHEYSYLKLKQKERNGATETSSCVIL
ncbi:UPF0545 protein C22orf39 homolog [Limulus polyphemus]|uniref:Synaptic plasticity regulator PANTS n=1 Tax=Limulus polyphemus TaxID=6850 RepID=A0ABM1C4V0_LIMPO|nr:UPF0545 protein C22orf39 homolog [Limulus polyphemus]